jgi:UDP-N-acetyl-D-glucosamine dehydrogenase
MREHPKLAGRKSIPFDPAAIRSYDAVLVVTDHDEIDWNVVLENAQLVVDARNITRKPGLDHAATNGGAGINEIYWTPK